MADPNTDTVHGQNGTTLVGDPTLQDDDIWAQYGTKKGKKSKKTKVVSPTSEEPTPEKSGNYDWDFGWASNRGVSEPSQPAASVEDGQPVQLEPARRETENDDWSSFFPKKKKSGITLCPVSDEGTATTGTKSEMPQPVQEAKEQVEPPVKSASNIDDIEVVNELGHGAVGSCLCERCVNEARQKVEQQLKEPNWTSNYISKLQAQISVLELRNESLSQRRGRRYSFSESSIASLSDDGEPSPFCNTARGPPGSESNIIVIDQPAEPAKEDRGLKLDIKRRRKIQQKYGDHKIERDDDPGMGEFGAQNTSNEHVLTVFREFDQKKHFWRRCIEIVSPPFLEVLRQESAYDIDLRLTDDRLILHEPMMTLFHNRKVLNRYIEKGGYASDSDEVKEARSHTKLILDFMRKELSESKVHDDLESAEPSGLIEFPNIWMLYPPGTTVYTKENGEYEAFIVDSVHGVHKSTRQKSGQHSYSRLELTCWSIHYDGEIFGRVWSNHSIFPFKGSKEVSSLQLVPEKFLPEAESVKSSLQSRGSQFWALQGQNYREYHGEIWSQHMSEDAIRVMIDHLTYQRREDWPISINNKHGPAEAQSKNWRENRFGNNYRSPPPPVYDDYPRGRRGRRPPPPPILDEDGYGDCGGNQEYNQDDGFEGLYERNTCDRPPTRANSKFKQYDLIKPDATPDDLTLLLCPQHVHGYCLRDKVWKSLNVNQLKPVNFRKNAWDRLVLDEEYKDIVQAMVSSYVEKSSSLEDLVAGKGAGLVALLHGPPGIGKTLTAECVADSFEKPLYQVTCGDIGTDPAYLESRLEEIFDYAVTWGAILLLDEADVFLQERDYLHLARNALVSIFLRTLEYFNGILFLTTNRIGTFDQAFQSRVHVTLGLPPLDRTRRTEVWSIFLDDLASKSLLTAPQHATLTSLVHDQWSKEKLNGRQIRNAVRTAMLVAEKKKEVPGKGHFETVLKIGRDFERYMSALQMAEGETVAEKKGERLAGVEGFEEVEGV